MPTDDAARTHDPGRAAAGLDVLAERVRAARGASEDDPIAESRRLASIERDLLAVSGELIRSDPNLEDDRGHPVLAEVGRWRRRCLAAELKREARRAGELLAALVEDEATRWREAARAAIDRGSAQDAFDLLGEASVLDQEAMRRRGRRPGRPPLAGDRVELRAALVERIAADPPPPDTQDRWVTELLDRADVVLTGIDELTPAASGAQLRVVEDDLAWYLGHVARERGKGQRRLKRKLRRIRAEVQERRLQSRLEGIFGERSVARFERLVVFLIFLVLALLAIEVSVDLSPTAQYWFTILDTLACLVFLWDFFFRWWLVKGKWLWFRRHVLIDLVPSIPVGLLALQRAGPDPIRAGRALRLVRATRIARSVRLLMPVIRIFRALGFLSRGMDRVIRRYGHLLNRDVILYPTREEKARARAAEDELAAKLRRTQSDVADLWEDLLLSAEGEEAAAVARIRLEELERARADGLTRRPPMRRVHVPVTREVPADALLRRLERATPEGVEADLGADFVTRAARAVRLFARPPLRWIPFLGSLSPRLGPDMTDAEVVAAGAHHASDRLRRHLDRHTYFADLHGTITPAEFVDRVGSTMMRGAARPAYRLTLIGGVYVLAWMLLALVPWSFFEWLVQTLGPLLAELLVILGSICFVILGLGWWLKRLAQEATTFYESVALAQFLPLTESIKGRFLDRDAEILCRRVIAPEALLRGGSPAAELGALRSRFRDGARIWLLEANSGGDATGAFDAMERTLLLHRDSMDGGLLHASDTRTTNQLLGNPAIRHLVRTAWCVARKERKELRALDLESQRRLLGGPYLWFNLVTRAVSQAAARLIVEYNLHAIPLDELAALDEQGRARYEAWLERRLDQDGRDASAAVRRQTMEYVTSAFTALHVLDDDPRRDHEVSVRFGPAVLDRLRVDRRRLFRRIFGTYPLHKRPHEQRVLNLYQTYERYLSGGKALLIPVRGLWVSLRWLGRFVLWVVRAVGEIRHPPPEVDDHDAEADFDTAVRKIDRMRGPLVLACLSLRVRLDVEYLGVRLPGARRTGLEGVEVDRDLDFFEAPVRLRRIVEQEHDQAQADMRRLDRLLDGGLLDRIRADLGLEPTDLGRQHLRGAAFAYRGDLRGVRSLLSAQDVLEETVSEAAHRPVLPGLLLPRPRSWWRFRRWWRAHGDGGRHARKAAWRAVLHDVNGSQRALEVRAGLEPEEATRLGEERLRELLRHPGRLSGQLVTLRAVSTLALIDVLNYREHVWRLGEYAADGDDPRELLRLQDELEVPTVG